MTTLDQVNVRRMMIHAERVIREGLSEFNNEPQTLESKVRMKEFIRNCYTQLGLSQHYSVEIESAYDLVEIPTTRTLSLETDGSVQVGDGNGPEVIVGQETIKVGRPGNELFVNIKVTRPAETIIIDFDLKGKE